MIYRGWHWPNEAPPKIRVSVSRLTPEFHVPRSGFSYFLYALVSVDAPLRIRYIGITQSPRERFLAHGKSRTGKAFRDAGKEMRMMILSGPLHGRAYAQAVESFYISRFSDSDHCDLNIMKVSRILFTAEAA